MTLAQIVTQFWWAILLSMLGILITIHFWDKTKWWAMNTWYSFPLIGKLASLARNGDGKTDQKGWLKSERTLCSDYAKFIGVKSEKDFNRYNSYLTKAGDLGRKPLSAFMWLLIIALVIVEAMGFSYVLAGYTVPGASEAMQTYGAIGIAFLISVILVFLTHYTGHELYRNSKINEARQEWRDSGKPDKLSYYNSISLDKDADDDGKYSFTQMVHRVGKTPKHAITTLTIIFILLVAVGATYIRGVVLEKQLTEEVIGTQTSYFNTTSNLPKDLMKEVTTSEEKALQDTQNLDREGGWTTFIILAVIFVFLQILGIILGFKYGFAGLQSNHAYKALGNGQYHTYGEVEQALEELIATAQAKLETLHQKLEERNSDEGTEPIKINPNNNFRAYLMENAIDREKHIAELKRQTAQAQGDA